jgi:hypothetical protein
MVRIWRAGDQLPGFVSQVLAGHGEGGVRLTLEDVETNAAQSVNVGVVDLGKEADLGWGHGVVIWEEELELENTT